MRFERPAVFLLNGRGDQLLALPAMRALATVFTGGVQLILGQGMYEFFYRGLPMGGPVRAWWKDREKLSIDVERIASSAKTCDLFVCLSTIDAPSIAELARKLEARWSAVANLPKAWKPALEARFRGTGISSTCSTHSSTLRGCFDPSSTSTTSPPRRRSRPQRRERRGAS